MTTEKDIQNNDDYQYNAEYDEKLMDHDYDGIKELDNPAPAWIMAIFYITITFAVFYGAYYFWFGQGPTQEEEYAADNLAYAEKYKDVQSNKDLKILTDEVSVAEGAGIYNEMGCATCHGANGEGNAVGPNLTDNFWKNGCSFDEVFTLVKDGKTATAMTAYKTKMSDTKIQKVVSYILVKLKDSNPANAKDAEGEECK